MSSNAELMQKWLGDCYAALVIRRNRDRGETTRQFGTELRRNQDLAACARDELARLHGDPAITQRCFISKKHAEILKAALAA